MVNENCGLAWCPWLPTRPGLLGHLHGLWIRAQAVFISFSSSICAETYCNIYIYTYTYTYICIHIVQILCICIYVLGVFMVFLDGVFLCHPMIFVRCEASAQSCWFDPKEIGGSRSCTHLTSKWAKVPLAMSTRQERFCEFWK